MKVAVERRSKYFGLTQALNYSKDEIDKTQKEIFEYAVKEDKLINLKRFYAASKLQALARGVLTRILYKELQIENQAVRKIQKVIRGKLGRIRWMKQYWMSLSVVKSEHALQVRTEKGKNTTLDA